MDSFPHLGLEQGARPQPPQLLESGTGPSRLVAPFGEVEKIDLDSGVGQQGRDLAAHDAGAQDGDSLDTRAVGGLMGLIGPWIAREAHAPRPDSPNRNN